MHTTCGFGHLYDSDQYASCPYCNQGTRAIVFSGNDTQPPVPNGTEDRTVAPGMGTVGSTFGQPGNTSEAIPRTEMPDYLKAQIRKEKIDKTVGYYEKKHGYNPVVGWLVCIEGTEKGKDFRLYNKINTIGRSEENDVSLANANAQTISLKDHVRLAYDARHNNFQLIPGSSTNIVYVNNEPLYVHRLLNAYDVIDFNDIKLMFVPFCAPQFQWPQEEEK